MRRNSGIIGPKQSTSLSSASGVHEIFDNYNCKIDNTWPRVKKLVSCSPNSGNHYEGEQKSFTVTVDGFENGDTVYYTIASVSGTVNTTDFSNSSISGSFTVNSSGVGSFSKTLNRDSTSETESYKIEFRQGSISGNIFGESGTFTIPNPSYTLTASNSSPNEGDTVTFTLTGTNTYTGTHYYTLTGSAGTNDLNSNTSGSYSYNGSTGVFSISIIEDYLTEGNETLTAYARVNYTGGAIVAQTTVTINDTSKTVSATCTPDVSTVDEGSNVTFTVNTTNFTSGTLNWDTVLSADMESSDISATSGTVSISGSTGSIVITATSDGYTETGQTESFQVRVYDPNNVIMVTSSSVAINDTSTGTAEPQGTDITTSFYEISNRFIDSQSYMGGSNSDYTGPYDVGEVSTNFSGSGRVYIGVKATASTTFYNDVPIAGVQIISGTTLVASWIFNSSSGGSGSGWQTYTSQTATQSSQGFPVTPATASGYTYSNITTGTGVGKFAWATSTSSSYTGAADGISNIYKLTADGGSNILATVGDAQISQTSSTYYAYRETSGSTRYTGAIMRSPSYTFGGGEKIRVIHALTGPTSTQMDPDDTLYVAVY